MEIEISWDNRDTFKEDGIEYIFAKGKSSIDADRFYDTIKGFISVYNQ